MAHFSGPPETDPEGIVERAFASPLQLDKRQFERLPVQARSRIRIGKRAYAGYIEDISEAGARLVTLTPIRGAGHVVIHVPDLQPISGELRWHDGCVAGVRFYLKLDNALLNRWLSLRIPRAA